MSKTRKDYRRIEKELGIRFRLGEKMKNEDFRSFKLRMRRAELFMIFGVMTWGIGMIQML